MKYKIWMFAILLSCSMRSHQSSILETRGGNGGGGFLCQSETGERYVEMIDVWEAKHRWNLEVGEPNLPRDRWQLVTRRAIYQALGTLRMIRPDMANFVRKVVAARERSFWDENQVRQHLPLPEDINLVVQPENCEVVSVFLYYDADSPGIQDDLLLIDYEYYHLVKSPINHAAGKLHEGIYRYLRFPPRSITDSTLTRKIVACLLFTLDPLGNCNDFLDWSKVPM